MYKAISFVIYYAQESHTHVKKSHDFKSIFDIIHTYWNK